MAHAKWSPSGFHRTMLCGPSMAEEMDYVRVGASVFADEGTAAHTLMADCLLQKREAASFIGRVITVVTTDEETGKEIARNDFKVDDEMAGYIQTVLDSVNEMVAKGWTLLCEQRVDFSNFIGIPNQFGTADIILISPDGKHVSVRDLKYGRGHKVYPEGNHQMLAYGVGTLETFDGLMGDFETFDLWVYQPRLNTEAAPSRVYTRDELIAFGADMKKAAELNAFYIDQKFVRGNDISRNLKNYNPGPKTCLWCKHKPNCKAYEKMVLDEVAADFRDLDAEDQKMQVITQGVQMPKPDRLGSSFALLDMVEEWCRSVRAECERQTMAGVEIIGVDGLPLKLIEGRKGNRKWINEEAAEALLVGILPPEKAYEPRKIISPSKAAQLLDKKKTQETWKLIEPAITQSPGSPKVVEGSAPGTPWTGEVQDSEFVDLSTQEEA